MRSVTAPVFDVQRFSIHDGPGIRTLVFLKGCNLRCAWCQNPESQDVSPVVAFYASRCGSCFRCSEVCRAGAILNEGYRIDHDRCDLCLACVNVCPHGALRAIGENLTPETLFERLLEDWAYFDSSDGGVTFSGGEPTLYPSFMKRILDLCRSRGIHTAIETCGTFSYARWAPIFLKVQLIYFDLKVMDEERHRRETGRGNARILENAARLVRDGYPIEFRMPLVPGHTDDTDNLAATATYLKQVGVPRIQLLAYHNMGEAKIDIIRGRQPKLRMESCTQERLHEVARWFEQRGIGVGETT